MRRWFAIGIVALAIIPSVALADIGQALTPERIAKFSPRARADLVAALVRHAPDIEASGINTPRRLFAFLAQISTETGGLTRIDENLNYSAKRLRQIFPKRVTAEQADALAFKPVLIANHVYGGRLGNLGQHTQDGWTYRGSGYIQLTGRGNFESVGKELGLNLVEDPEQVRLPSKGLTTALSFWKVRDLNPLADKGSVAQSIQAVRLKVNGGMNGLDHCKVWYGKAVTAFQDAFEGVESPDEMIFQGVQLERDGIGSILGQAGITVNTPEAGAAIDNRAVEEFQKQEDLPVTGNLDEETFYALMDPSRLIQDE